MHTDAQIFPHQLPAPATALAGVARINQYDTPASLFRFARRDEYELIPRRICNAFRQTVVFEHSTCTYVLKGKDAETIDQFPAFLLSEVASPVHYSFVNAADNFAALCSFWRTFLGFRQLALRFLSSCSSDRKKRGLAIFSPFDNVANASRPTSTPIAASDKASGCGSVSTLKLTYHLPVALRRIVTILIRPSTGRCKMTLIDPILLRMSIVGSCKFVP